MYLNSVWFRFGSVSVSRPGSVHVRFRFLRFLVDFGSVGFGVWNILHWYLFFFRRRKSKYRLLPARGFIIASRKWFHEQRLSKSGESWTRKTKVSWNCQCRQFNRKKPIFAYICFFHWTPKAITAFPISLLGEGKTVPVPPVRFCTRFQRFTVPIRFIGYLIFYGSVPRFRFGSRTLLLIFGNQDSRSLCESGNAVIPSPQFFSYPPHGPNEQIQYIYIPPGLLRGLFIREMGLGSFRKPPKLLNFIECDITCDLTLLLTPSKFTSQPRQTIAGHTEREWINIGPLLVVNRPMFGHRRKMMFTCCNCEKVSVFTIGTAYLNRQQFRTRVPNPTKQLFARTWHTESRRQGTHWTHDRRWLEDPHLRIYPWRIHAWYIC